jgi:hypothetical protein
MVKKPSKIKTLERKKEKINKSSNYSKELSVEEEKKKEPLHIVNTVPVIGVFRFKENCYRKCKSRKEMEYYNQKD